MLYTAYVLKNMNLMMNETDKQSSVAFAAAWSPDGQATPTLQNVRFMLPKGKHNDFKGEIEKLQAAME